MKKLIVAIAIAGLVGCNSQKVEQSATENSESAVTTDTPEIKDIVVQEDGDLLTTIKANISSKTCNSNADCGALAVGHRACGGPNEYLPYSKLSSNEESLKSLAKKHQQQEKIKNKKEGRMSICQMLTEPQVACKSNQCLISSSFNGADI
jgi:hypothetical protein